MGLKNGLKLAAIAAVTASLYAVGATAAAEPANPLIGKWHFIGFGSGPTTSSSGCSIDMTFAPAQWTQTRGGATTHARVTYIPSAKVVYVVGSDGGHVTYILVGPDRIALDSFAPCTYDRVS